MSDFWQLILEFISLVTAMWPLMLLGVIPGLWLGRDNRIKALRFVFSILTALWVFFFGLRVVLYLVGWSPMRVFPGALEPILFFGLGPLLLLAVIIVFIARKQEKRRQGFHPRIPEDMNTFHNAKPH